MDESLSAVNSNIITKISLVTAALNKIMNNHQISHAEELSDKSLQGLNQYKNLCQSGCIKMHHIWFVRWETWVHYYGEQTLERSGGRDLENIYILMDWTHSLYSGRLRQTQTLYYKDETVELKYWKIIFINIYIHV